MLNKKTKIIIASVLKPADDVRNYEKIGLSLARNLKAEITVCGIQNSIPAEENIFFHVWPKFRRLSIRRLLTQIHFFNFIKKSSPDLIIVTTHELLFVGVLCKIIFGCKLIYDIQEDYFKNIWHQQFYPPILRHFMAIVIRTTEFFCSTFISHFFLAERMYISDIGFGGKKKSVLNNRSLEIKQTEKISFKVVFTGTISQYTRAKESIELYLKIRSCLPNSTMTLIGYCPSSSYAEMLKKKFDKRVSLKISDQPVPHNEIIKEIESASLGIIGYEANPVNHLKIPTKMFEYVASKTPYIVREGTYWEKIGMEMGGAISLNFNDPDFDLLKTQLERTNISTFSSEGILWEENEKKLILLVNNLISQ